MAMISVVLMMAGFVWGAFAPKFLILLGVGMVLAFVQMCRDEQKKNSKKAGQKGLTNP